MTSMVVILNAAADIAIGAMAIIASALAAIGILICADSFRDKIGMAIKYTLYTAVIAVICWGIGNNIRIHFP